MNDPPGIYEATQLAWATASWGPCPWCSSMHTGFCPRVEEIEYHPNGTIKRVKLRALADPPGQSEAQKGTRE